MTRAIKLKLPSPQNFIVLDVPVSNVMQPGLQRVEQPSIPIENLSETEAEQYAEELKQQFINHYKFRKLNPAVQINSRLLNHQL